MGTSLQIMGGACLVLCSPSKISTLKNENHVPGHYLKFVFS